MAGATFFARKIFYFLALSPGAVQIFSTGGVVATETREFCLPTSFFLIRTFLAEKRRFFVRAFFGPIIKKQ